MTPVPERCRCGHEKRDHQAYKRDCLRPGCECKQFDRLPLNHNRLRCRIEYRTDDYPCYRIYLQQEDEDGNFSNVYQHQSFRVDKASYLWLARWKASKLMRQYRKQLNRVSKGTVTYWYETTPGKGPQ